MRKALRTTLPGPGGHGACVAWRLEPRPLDWPARFGRATVPHVELGFGDGDYLTRTARAHPERDFVGIDYHWKRCQQAMARLTSLGLPNVRILHAEGRVALERLFTTRSIASLTALFPTPWRKRRHVAARFFSTATLALLNSRLVDGGTVRVVTDDAGYAGWILEQLPGGFDARQGRPEGAFDTYYERRWRSQGLPRFIELVLTKVDHLDRPIVEDAPVRTHLVTDFDPDRFAPADARGGPTVVFREFVHDPRRRRALQHAIVNDDGFTQDAWIAIVAEGSAWRVGPVRQSATVPTPGLQRALDLVYEAVRRSAGLDLEGVGSAR
jgi:tRNA (guanine-N7-)-methyltransferase